MSQLSTDVRTFVGIVSDLFDGKTNLDGAGARLDQLGQTISGQVNQDLSAAGRIVGKVEAALGPQATAAINTALDNAKQAGAAALTILDDDLAPYMAAGAKAAEGALDGVLDAAVPGGVMLNPLVNGGIDAIANGLKAAIDVQAAARKAQLLALPNPAPAPAPAQLAPASAQGAQPVQK